MKIGLRIVLVLLIAGGCASKTTTKDSKKEMSTQPVAQRAPQESTEKRVIEIQPGPLEGPYAALLNYDFPKSRAALSAIEDDIRNAPPQQYVRIEARLLAV